MCGIFGVVLPNPEQRMDEVVLRAMADALRYRGPDAEGLWNGPGAWIGHRRLKVIDLEGGIQPMRDQEAGVVLSYNGEIYNFQELRRELESLGSRFQTRSDTEVLLKGYVQWGAGILERIVGMYAFAAWDERSRTLLLARDRIGVKPLYWAGLPKGGLVFASELNAILASGLLTPRVNPDAAARYCAFGYVQGEESIIQEVRRLPPAAMLTWRDGEATTRKYWDMIATWKHAATSPMSEAEVAEAFMAQLDQATTQRMISDVPLGAFLSGGIDSSTVAALMKRHKEEVHTYSIGFKYASFDESGHARRTASALECRHHEELVDCRDPSLLLEVVSRLDEPFADTSILPTYALCRMARKHVTVALSGDGADELLAGYVTNLADRYHGLYSRVPAPIAALAKGLVGLLPDSRRKVNIIYKMKQFARAHGLVPAVAHGWWRTICPPGDLGALFPGMANSLPDIYAPYRDTYEAAEGLAPLDRFLYVDYQTWLIDDILTKADRASMNHGLELRSPFLDTRLLELMMRAPTVCKLSGKTTKVVLRKVAKNLVPSFVLTRRKAGFSSPVSHWLRDAWQELAHDAFGDMLRHHMPSMNSQWIGRRWAEHRRRRDHGYFLFALLVLSLWLREKHLSI